MKTLKSSILIALLFGLLASLHAQSGWFLQSSTTKEMLNSVCFVNQNVGWVAGGPDICFTRDGGSEWVKQNYPCGLNDDFFFNSVYFIDELTGFVTGTVSSIPHFAKRNLILKTTNGGVDWFRMQCCGGSELFSVHFEDTFIGWAAGNDYIINTTDGGMTWAPQPVPAAMNDTYTFTSVFFINKMVGWVAGKLNTGHITNDYNVLFKTTNGGQEWIRNFVIEGEGFNSVYFENTMNGWAVGNNTIYFTKDGGKYWEESYFPSGENDYFTFKSVHFVNPLIGWVSGELFVDPPQRTYSIVIKTYDGGLNWNIENLNTELCLNSIHFEDADIGWTVGKEGAIYKTTNGGKSFDDRVSKASGKKPVLSQNYPNPFNPVTKISFTVSKNSFVSLKVYDMSGREVKSLVNETKSPGNYSVDFNGSDFTSGVYFYKIQAGDFTETKRMMLVK